MKLQTLGLSVVLTLLLASLAPVTASPAQQHVGPSVNALPQRATQIEPPPPPVKDAGDAAARRDARVDPLAPDLQAKIDPRILQELSGEIIPAHLGGQADPAAVAPHNRQPLEKTRFLVYLQAQADLQAATARPFATRAERRSAVADALLATAQQTQGPIKMLLDTRMSGGSVAAYQPFYIFNGFAVEGNLDTLLELAKRDDVKRIAANYPLVKLDQPDLKAAPSPASDLGGLDPANWNIDMVDAERVWNQLGVWGEGAVVGDFDTGVDWMHPALLSRYRGYGPGGTNHNYNWFEPDTNLYPSGDLGPSVSSVPWDCDGHGTHTMGTMVGDGGTSTTHVGMAPGAKWIAAPGICGNTMPGYFGDDIGGNKAFQWFLCPTDLAGQFATRDCSQAPDVINNSWGSSNPADDTFRPAIQALRAAGIAPVFAAGNPSAGAGSIGSPASAPEAITVGATDVNDTVASFSGRGPSFYEGEQKPELAAPGVGVNSTTRGGGYSGTTWSGTSMAAPAVSGLVALMVSADLKDGRQDLNVDEIERFIEYTAKDLGPTGPDDDYGYGRINAYDAVRWALGAGDLRGTVRDANTLAPIGGATVVGVKPGLGDTFGTRAASTGMYSATVPGGAYNVTASAFGYVTRTFLGVDVITGTSSIVDLALTPLSTAWLTGRVLSGTMPVAGALVYVDAMPSVSYTTGADGVYALTLPVGTHAMSVKANGYRIKRESVTVAASGSTRNLAMTPAPTILLVEGDAYRGWFWGRPARKFFQASLDERNYIYDTFNITDTASLYLLSSLMTPGNYGLVIWVQTVGSPGWTGAISLLQNYLDAGGRLILSGQNIASADGSTTFVQDYMHATPRMDTAAGIGQRVSGVGFLNGIGLTLNDAALYSFPNTTMSLSPDAVAPRDGNAYAVMTYDNGSGAAVLAVDPCSRPYRAVFFAVGYENLGPRAHNRPPEYADALDRSIQWVTQNRPAFGASALITPGSQSAPPGTLSHYSLTVANTSNNADRYDLLLSGNIWPTHVYSDSTVVMQTRRLEPCESQTLDVQVTIPDSASVGATDVVTVTATSQASPSARGSVSARTTAYPLWQAETPMPTQRYRLGAAALPNTPYYIAVGGQDWYNSLSVNERYDACSRTWTTLAPLPAPRGNINATVLNGRVYVVGGYGLGGTYYDSTFVYDPTANAWSVATNLPAALAGVATAAASGKLYAFGGYGPTGFVGATYEYDPTSGTWTPKSPMPGGARGYASAAELGGKIYVSGGWPDLVTVEIYDPLHDAWSTASPMNVGRQAPGLVAAPDGYLYVSGGGNYWNGLSSAERYSPATDTWTLIPSLQDPNRAGSASAFVAGRVFAVGGTAGYLSSLNEALKLSDAFCLSNIHAQPPTVQPGDRITYTIELHSESTGRPGASVRDPLPTGTTFSGFGPATVSPAPTYNVSRNRVEWNGSLLANHAPVTFTFSVIVDNISWSYGQLITNTATFNDGGSATFDRQAVTRLDFISLSTSSKSVNKSMAVAGEVLTYTIHVRNESRREGSVTLSDPIPANTTYVPGSLTTTVSGAGYDSSRNTITWASQLPAIGTYVNTSGDYQWGDSRNQGNVPGVQYDWIEIRNTGAELAALTGADDSHYYPLALPFTFRFYGAEYTDLAIASNGAVYFENLYLGWSNMPIPSANGNGINTFIAHLWDDLVVWPGAIYYQVLGSAPHRMMVIEFYQISVCCTTPEHGTWEIILYEGSGIIRLQYQDVYFGRLYADYGSSATVGIQNTSSQGVQYSYNTPALSDGLAILFLPPRGSVSGLVYSADITFAVTTAAPLPVNTRITNTAIFTDNRGAVYRRWVDTLMNSVALDGSYKLADRTEAGVGDPVNYTVVLRNSGVYVANGVTMRDPIPANTAWDGVNPTCTSGTCTYSGGAIHWTGNVAPGDPVSITFGVMCNTPLPDRTLITNTATINSGTGGQVLTRQAVFMTRAFNLSSSYKTVTPAVSQPGQVVTYTIYAYNSGDRQGAAQLYDMLPANLSYVPGSLVYGSGSGSYAGGAISWSGIVPALSQVPIQFKAKVSSGTLNDYVIVNTATITDVTGGMAYHPHVALTIRLNRIYLPVVIRQ